MKLRYVWSTMQVTKAVDKAGYGRMVEHIDESGCELTVQPDAGGVWVRHRFFGAVTMRDEHGSYGLKPCDLCGRWQPRQRCEDCADWEREGYRPTWLTWPLLEAVLRHLLQDAPFMCATCGVELRLVREVVDHITGEPDHEVWNWCTDWNFPYM